MYKDIKTFIKCYQCCQIYKSQPSNKFPEDIPIPPGLLFTRVDLDLVGPLNTTRRGNRYIIVLVDYFFKREEAEPLIKAESEDIIRILWNIRIINNGYPQFIHILNKYYWIKYKLIN